MPAARERATGQSKFPGRFMSGSCGATLVEVRAIGFMVGLARHCPREPWPVHGIALDDLVSSLGHRGQSRLACPIDCSAIWIERSDVSHQMSISNVTVFPVLLRRIGVLIDVCSYSVWQSDSVEPRKAILVITIFLC